MIRIDASNNKFTVKLDPKHPMYSRVLVVTRSLLSTRSCGEDQFYISYDDVCILRQKLDSLGLTSDRKISESGAKLLADISAFHKRNEDIKKGIHNDHVKKLLEGKLKTTLYDDQITGISYLLNNKRSGLFDSMGLGKSVQSLSVIVASPDIRKTLIICPLSVTVGFEREVQKHTNLKAFILPSGKLIALETLRNNMAGNWDILITHPENLISTGNKKEIYSDVTKLLKSMKFDLILIDEFHQFKNLEAKRTKCVMSLTDEIRNKKGEKPRVIIMTGTPVSESPVNAYAALRLIGKDFSTNLARFENYYTIKKDVSYGSKGTFKKTVGYKNLAELKQVLERVSIRRTKNDMKGFPDKSLIIRDIVLSGRQLKLYKAACEAVIDELPKESVINLSNFFSDSATTIRLRQLMNHPLFLEEDCPSAKYDELDSIFEELLEDPEQKVIVWTEFRKGVDLVYDRWNSQYGVQKLYGGVDITSEMIKSFEEADRPRIVVAIPAKAGTGTDFLARCRTAIYLDRPYSYTLYMQSIDRIHRRVKTDGELTKLDKIRSQPATIIFLDVVNSIDEIVREKLNSKQDLADAIMESNSKLISMGREDLLKYLR